MNLIGSCNTVLSVYYKALDRGWIFVAYIFWSKSENSWNNEILFLTSLLYQPIANVSFVLWNHIVDPVKLKVFLRILPLPHKFFQNILLSSIDLFLMNYIKLSLLRSIAVVQFEHEEPIYAKEQVRCRYD